MRELALYELDYVSGGRGGGRGSSGGRGNAGRSGSTSKSKSGNAPSTPQKSSPANQPGGAQNKFRMSVEGSVNSNGDSNIKATIGYERTW